MPVLEQDNLSEIKFDLGFFPSVLSQRGNRGQCRLSLENEFLLRKFLLLRQEEGVRGWGIGIFKRLVLYKSWPPLGNKLYCFYQRRENHQVCLLKSVKKGAFLFNLMAHTDHDDIWMHNGVNKEVDQPPRGWLGGSRDNPGSNSWFWPSFIVSWDSDDIQCLLCGRFSIQVSLCFSVVPLNKKLAPFLNKGFAQDALCNIVYSTCNNGSEKDIQRSWCALVEDNS